MTKITHKQQQEIWDSEHKNPKVLVQMDSQEASGGLIKFWDYLLRNTSLINLVGIEMGCGKGRNVIWLAEQSKIKKVSGFDFSASAIETAKRRVIEKKLESKADFSVGDATEPWPFPENYFDFAIDCFASTDIESPEGRRLAINEIYRTLKPGGLFMVYALTPEDEFHAKMIIESPAEEKNAFYHTTGKFEKTFDRKELEDMYRAFEVVEWQRVDKVTQFFGKNYKCKHFWMIFKKPVG